MEYADALWIGEPLVSYQPVVVLWLLDGFYKPEGYHISDLGRRHRLQPGMRILRYPYIRLLLLLRS